MASGPRKPFSVRLGPKEKQKLDELADRSGLESGLIARAVLELFLRNVSDDDSVFQILADLEMSMRKIELARSKANKAA